MNNAPWWFKAATVNFVIWCVYSVIYYTVNFIDLFRQWRKGSERSEQDEP